MASRPFSTPGSARGDAREPVVARVIEFVPRVRAMAAPANDNAHPPAWRLFGLVGTGLGLALAVGLYLYLC